MALYAKLPRGVALGKKASIVASVGAPGRGVGLATRTYADDVSRTRILALDAELRPTSDVTLSFEGRDAFYDVTPLAGSAWRDGRPALYLFGRPPIACDVAEDGGALEGERWLAAATEALRTEAWAPSAMEQMPRPPGSDYSKGQPRCGVFLPDAWLMGALHERSSKSPHCEQLFRFSLETPSRRSQVWMLSRDPIEDERRRRLRPRVFTRLVRLRGHRVAFAGCSVVKSGAYEFRLGHYDVAADELHAVRTEHHTERVALAHDGRERILVQEGERLYRYDLSLGAPDTVSADTCAFLKSWRLLGGNAEGHTLWLGARAKAICLAAPEELAGALSESLEALGESVR